MISTTPATDIWIFQSKYKQSVSDYFKAYPGGTYDHFLDNWPRAHQIDRHLFDEVYFKLQKAGAINMIEGGKAHQQLVKEIEKKAEERVRAEMAKAAPVTVTETENLPAPSPIPETVPQPPTEKESSMPKVYKLSDLIEDERKTLDTIFQKNPNITHDALCKELGYLFDKTAYYPISRKVKEGTYDFPGINGFKARHNQWTTKQAEPVSRGVISKSPVNTTNTPLVNYTKINGIQIIGQIDTEGWTKEEIRCFRARLPTALTEILHRSMQFKVVQFTEDDEEGGKEKVTLEVRRIA